MYGVQRKQPRWGWTMVALVAILIILLVVGGAVEAALLTAIIAVLVLSYLMRARIRRRLLYRRHDLYRRRDEHGPGTSEHGHRRHPFRSRAGTRR